MSDTPIYDKLSSEFDASKKWWKKQGAMEEVEFLLGTLRSIPKPTKQITGTIEALENRLKELGKLK